MKRHEVPKIIYAIHKAMIAGYRAGKGEQLPSHMMDESNILFDTKKQWDNIMKEFDNPHSEYYGRTHAHGCTKNPNTCLVCLVDIIENKSSDVWKLLGEN